MTAHSVLTRPASPAADLDSLLAPGHRVSVDAFGLNPLAAEALELFPGLCHLARLAAGPPPKMFADGAADFPAYAASGIDPVMLLLRTPYRARHHVAGITTPDKVLADFRSAYANNPTAHVEHPGLAAAVERMRAWLQEGADAHTVNRKA